MPDFTGGGIYALPSETRSIGDASIDRRIHDLVRDYGCNASSAMIREMIVTALKIVSGAALIYGLGLGFGLARIFV